MTALNGMLPLHRAANATPAQEGITDLVVTILDATNGAVVQVLTEDANGKPLRTSATGAFSVPLSGVDTTNAALRFHVRVKAAHALSVQVNDVSLVPPPGTFAVTLPSLPMPPEGDVNGDDRISLVDFSLLAASFGKTTGEEGFDARTDFNQDGGTDLLDFSRFVGSGAFGTEGPLAGP